MPKLVHLTSEEEMFFRLTLPKEQISTMLDEPTLVGYIEVEEAPQYLEIDKRKYIPILQTSILNEKGYFRYLVFSKYYSMAFGHQTYAKILESEILKVSLRGGYTLHLDNIAFG